MIAKLSGFLDSTGPDWLIIDVGGVGYHVSASSRTLSQVPPTGQKLSLVIETLVRNEQTQLFGFSQEEERAWFRLLIAIQGVGAKVALALLSALPPDELHQAIVTGDQTLITRAEGVGPKLAGRIVAELKGKAGAFNLGLPTATPQAAPGLPFLSSAATEAVSALANLGYRRSEAVQAVAQSSQALGADVSVEALVRQGLKVLSQFGGPAHG